MSFEAQTSACLIAHTNLGAHMCFGAVYERKQNFGSTYKRMYMGFFAPGLYMKKVPQHFTLNIP